MKTTSNEDAHSAAGSKRPRRKRANHLGQRSVSFSDIWAFLLCELRYMFYKLGADRVEDRPHDIVGQIVHEAVAKGDAGARQDKLETQLKALPKDQRAEVEADAQKCLENSETLEAEDDGKYRVRTERLIRVTDEETGWDLVAKPDEISRVIDDKFGKEVIQVVDKKTAHRLKDRDRDQVFFFGLVVYLKNRLTFSGSIKLVVKLLRADYRPVRTFWFSRSRVNEQLEEVRSVIRRIEAALTKGFFKPTTGEHCDYCPFREQCPFYTAWKNGDMSMTRKDDSTSRNDGSTDLPIFQDSGGGATEKTA